MFVYLKLVNKYVLEEYTVVWFQQICEDEYNIEIFKISISTS